MFLIIRIVIFCLLLGRGCGFDRSLEESDSLSYELRNYDEVRAAYEEESLDLVMIGDMLLHERVLKSSLDEEGNYNFDHLFTYTGDRIRKADIAIVNQETIIGGEELKIGDYPCFNSPYEVADTEYRMGFDLVLGATNHALDRHAKGIENEVKYFRDKYPLIKLNGIYDNKEDYDNGIVYIKKKGMVIAFLNYTYGTNGIKVPSGKEYLVNYLDKDKVVKDIREAKEHADFVVVCPHWGTEYYLGVDYYQKKWTDIFLKEGVDLVLGTHPHTVEPVQWLSGDDGHRMLVYYSLGNYVNGVSSHRDHIPQKMLGAMATVKLYRDNAGKVNILSHCYIPLVAHEAEGEAYTVYYLKDYTEELAKENWVVDLDKNFSKKAMEEIFYGLMVE